MGFEASFVKGMLVRRNTHHGQHRVRTACLSSLRDLRLDYLDLYLVCSPCARVGSDS